MGERFTSSRVPGAGIQALFRIEERWQVWLQVEATPALTQADFGMIPRDAADAIKAACASIVWIWLASRMELPGLVASSDNRTEAGSIGVPPLKTSRKPVMC